VLASGRWALVATLDPSYQLPASVVLEDDEADAVLPLTERLLRLLRERRFDDAQAAMDREALPTDAGFELALALCEDDEATAALCWLHRQGLLDDAQRNADGDSLAFVLRSEERRAGQGWMYRSETMNC